ncbi:DNA repair protein rad50 [Tulasnella sp. 332]|nr:DNA repair protein rad50 [Tulasnella sp. 332]
MNMELRKCNQPPYDLKSSPPDPALNLQAIMPAVRTGSTSPASPKTPKRSRVNQSPFTPTSPTQKLHPTPSKVVAPQHLEWIDIPVWTDSRSPLQDLPVEILDKSVWGSWFALKSPAITNLRNNIISSASPDHANTEQMAFTQANLHLSCLPPNFEPLSVKDEVVNLVNGRTIVLAEAKKVWKVDDAQMANLPYVAEPNPHHHLGASMKKYKLSAVRALAFKAHGGPLGHAAYLEKLAVRAAKTRAREDNGRSPTKRPATLDALAIRGIRSFDPQKMERINFAKPGVTVIVGHNGSGKTTIVECLKYATTGDQPPNTKGGAFVHDPKMAHEKEVKAQVKLRFYARNGVRMVATRNLMVTAKKTGLTMKTLESILDADNPNGGNKRSTISTKCAEIDAEIPHLLGVSKSVLENVIFCHQEDSYWPLSEPSVLKKKFDDIFEATKYTKALDNIKGIRKELVADLKVERERLDGLANEKKHAEKTHQLSNKISDITSEVEEKEETIQALQEEETFVEQQNFHFREEGSKFKEHYMKAEELEKRKAADSIDAQDTERQLGKEKLSPSVTDVQIQEQLASFDAIQRQKQAEVERINRLIKEEKEVEDTYRRKLKNVERQRGLLQGDAQRHEEDVATCEETIRKAAEAHTIQGYSQDSVDEFIAKLKTLQRRQAAETETIQNSMRLKGRQYAGKIADQQSQMATSSRERDSTSTQINRYQASISQAEGVADKNKSLETEIQYNTVDIADRKARLDKMVADFVSAKFDDKMVQKAKQITNTHTERDLLMDEHSKSSMQASDRAKLDVKRGDLKKKQAFVDRTLETHSAKFRIYFDVDAQPESMESDIEQLITSKTRELSRLEADYNNTNRESAELQSTYKRLKQEFADKKQEVTKLEKRLYDAVNANLEKDQAPSTLNQAIADANAELQDLQAQAGKIIGAGDFYKSLLDDGRKAKRCGVCDRQLASTKEMELFEETLQAKIAQTTADKIKENEDQIQDWATEAARLQAYLPMQADVARIRKDLPKLEKTLEDQRLKDEAGRAAADRVASALKGIKVAITDLNALREEARNVSRSNEEIAFIRTEITQLERNLQSTGSLRTASELQAEVDRTLEREKTLLQNEKEQQLVAQRTVENEIHAKEMKAGQLQARLIEGRGVTTRMEKEKEELVELKAKLPTFNAKISSLQSKVEELETEQKEHERQLSEKLSVAQRQQTLLNSSVLELDSVQTRIDKYVSEDSAQRLAASAKNVTELEAHVAKTVSSIDAKRIDMAAKEAEVNQGEARRSSLENNQRWRKLKRRIEETEIELESLPMEEAAESKRDFDVKYDAMQKRERDIKGKIARLSGEVSILKAQIKSYQKDLSNEFKNIKKRYMDQLIKVKMQDMASGDLEKYGKALDSAIMKYHSLKMEEVNDTMRHLWNKTYQGTDIDGIMIRSEGDTGTTKRSYNYRVVMMKDQVEMDMRGRCSAGQKMLASIIIRLALSDSFGQDCGILALDEPTNALDTENIEALASSLVEIINERRRAANFQLIIITHDENFLRKLGENGVVQDYWCELIC